MDQESGIDAARAALTALRPGLRWQAGLLYALAATERLYRWYDARPVRERCPYAETWRPVVAAAWAYAGGDDGAYRTVSDALGAFYLSPYSNSGYDDGPDDIDETEPAAAFATANCVVHGLVDFALVPAMRALDQLDFDWSGTDEDRRRAEVAAELERQAADLAVIVRMTREHSHLPDGVPADVIARLRG